jgi:hypothetical protein
LRARENGPDCWKKILVKTACAGLEDSATVLRSYQEAGFGLLKAGFAVEDAQDFGQ